MYSVEFSKKAEEQLLKLPREIQSRIIDVLERIKIRPHHFVKRYEGTPHFSLRVGKYRILLDIQNDKLIIYVIDMGLRGNIYK